MVRMIRTFELNEMVHDKKIESPKCVIHSLFILF